jgi:ubiquinone/menaquinone biosynthesis C-methylase UbiE
VLRLLQLAPKEHILDLACGQGAVCKLLHQAGAQVTGVDLSSRLVEMARRRSPKEIRFLVGDARRLDSLADASFDGIVSILALQNIDPLEPVFSECARLLRLDGRAVFVIMHPAFRMPRHSRWRFDEEQKTLLRESDAYLTAMQIPIDMRPFKRPGHRMTTTYHRPIEMYVTGLARAGLWVNALEEWPSHKSSQPGPRARAENRARSEFPLFLALRVVRVTSRVRG